MADTGHALSVNAAGGAGGLYNHPHREPECHWLPLWSYSKWMFGFPFINPS